MTHSPTHSHTHTLTHLHTYTPTHLAENQCCSAAMAFVRPRDFVKLPRSDNDIIIFNWFKLNWVAMNWRLQLWNYWNSGLWQSNVNVLLCQFVQICADWHWLIYQPFFWTAELRIISHSNFFPTSLDLTWIQSNNSLNNINWFNSIYKIK